jgi:hypothetical protein
MLRSLVPNTQRAAGKLGAFMALLVVTSGACSDDTGSAAVDQPGGSAGAGATGGTAGTGGASPDGSVSTGGASGTGAGGTQDAASDGQPDGAPDGQATIGPSGGVVTSTDGRLRIEISPGALSEPREITIEPATGVPAGSVGPAYELGPSGLTFDQPVVLSFKYDPSGPSPAALRVGTVSEDQWTPLTAPIVDVGQQRITALTAHFSVFGTYYESCRPDRPCFEPRQACVVGLAPDPVCAVPCRSDADCPDPLYCHVEGESGGCLLRGCYANPEACTRGSHECQHVYGYTDSPASYHNQLCLPRCDQNAGGVECPDPTYMQCVVDGCSAFDTCSDDPGCGASETCYHGGILHWAGNAGECISCDLGCDCRAPGCPCVSTTARQKRCGKCESHADCQAGESCENGDCVGCAPADNCTKGQTCIGSENCCPPFPGFCICDHANCVCDEIGNQCNQWHPCFPGDPENCGDGRDDNCNGVADEGCTPCQTDAECGTLERCDGTYCEACVAECTPGASCIAREGPGECIPIGNGCSICEPLP